MKHLSWRTSSNEGRAGPTVASIAGDVATFWASAGKGNEELHCQECDAFLEFATNSEQRRQTNRSCSATMLKETLQKKTPRAFRVRWDHYVVGAMRSGMGQHFLKDRLNVRQADEVVMMETAAVMLEAAAVEREAATATKKMMKASAVSMRPVVGRWLEAHAGEHMNISGVGKESRF